MRSEKGIGGLFSCPTTAVKTLETKSTTTRSINPVNIAIGKRVYKDLLVFKESFFTSLLTNLIVLLDISICNHNFKLFYFLMFSLNIVPEFFSKHLCLREIILHQMFL